MKYLNRIVVSFTTALSTHFSTSFSVLLLRGPWTGYSSFSKWSLHGQNLWTRKVTEYLTVVEQLRNEYFLHILCSLFFCFRSLGFGRRKHQMLDQLLIPMRKMKVDLCEFAAFKAIFFLNPGQFKISCD